MNLLFNSSILWAPSSVNRKYWQLLIEKDESGRTWWSTKTWRDTVSGQTEVSISERKPISETNVGKANHRNYVDQATAFMNSAVARKLDQGYVGPNGELGDRAKYSLTACMLADKFYPEYYADRPMELEDVYMQPKHDGVRCLTDGDRYWSRGGKFICEDAIKHIYFEEGSIPDGMILDGELVMQPISKYTFQQTVSRVKRDHGDKEQRNLKYIIYDAFFPEEPLLPFYARRARLLKLEQEEAIGYGTALSPTWVFHDLQSIQDMHIRLVEEGNEGSMIRMPYGVYMPGSRSKQLLKYKWHMDEEFEIVDVRDGQGKEEGHAIFICKSTYGGGNFDTRPRGTYEQRAEWFKDRANLIGKPLTVRHFGATDEGLVRCPIGLAVRDYE